MGSAIVMHQHKYMQLALNPGFAVFTDWRLKKCHLSNYSMSPTTCIEFYIEDLKFPCQSLVVNCKLEMFDAIRNQFSNEMLFLLKLIA